jgi:hypothetical protein
MLPWTITEKVLRDAEEMRAFYASFDLAPETTERALAISFPTLSSKQTRGHEGSRRKPPRGRSRLIK